MKHLLNLLLVLAVFSAHAQYPISSINISLPSNLPANTADWAAAMPPVMITAQAQMRNGQVPGNVAESRILVTINKGHTKMTGGYTSATAPLSGFNSSVKNWSGATAVSLLGKDYVLPPGTYELCVQLFGQGSVQGKYDPISNEVCKSFTILEAKAQNYNPPVNQSPVEKMIFSERDLKAPITFRWTPLCCKVDQPFTYKLRVWQIMKGQTGTQAMKTNLPVLEKDVKDQTQAIITNLVNEPCKAPNTCSFVWNVQALDKNEKGIGSNNGFSEYSGFSITNEQRSSCPRQNVSFFALADELSAVYLCTHPSSLCGSQQLEIKTKGYENGWLWEGGSEHIFTQSEQDQILTQAIQWAFSNRSRCEVGYKTVKSIIFFSDISTGPGGYVIGCKVEYACCNYYQIHLETPHFNELVNHNHVLPFGWKYHGEVDAVGRPSWFTLKIFEANMQDGRSIVDTSKVFFEVKELKEQSWKYPDNAPIFKTGQIYAWQVSIGELKSDVSFFMTDPLNANAAEAGGERSIQSSCSCSASQATIHKSLCLGQSLASLDMSVMFSGDCTGSISYSWNPAVLPTVSGEYQFICTATRNGVTCSRTVKIALNTTTAVVCGRPFE